MVVFVWIITFQNFLGSTLLFFEMLAGFVPKLSGAIFQGKIGHCGFFEHTWMMNVRHFGYTWKIKARHFGYTWKI